jgi:hypothetical protein
MFEKISGFFKQFTRRRKRQSGETTIMESKEPGGDEFGLDDDFADMDTFGDTEGSADSGDFVGTADMADTGGFSDFDLEDSGGGTGGMSDEFESAPRVEDEFSDFDITGADADISTGATDFDEQTVSDEISGPTEAEFGQTEGAEFGDAFAVGEEAPPYDEGAEVEVKGASFLKRVLTTVVALVVAVGVGAAFQIFAWPTVSTMVGLASDEVPIDPEVQLGEKKMEEKKLSSELRNFRAVGTPVEAQTMKAEIAEKRESQGSMEEFQAKFAAVKEKEAAYDALLKQIAGLEADIKKTGAEIENVRAEIEQAKRRVIELARQTEEEYKRFSFELARAELGQRLLIELQIQDIASFKEQVAELEKRLTKLSAEALISSAVEATSTEEAPMADTSEN